MSKFLSSPHAKIHPNDVVSLAIGKFDGMHLAHLHLLENLCDKGGILCIQTNEPKALTPADSKEQYTNIPFFYLTLESIKNLSGKEFAEFLCENFSHLRSIIIGYDFRFGKGREFGASDLCFLLPHIKITIFKEFCVNDMGVHSSLIKEFIALGNMKMANALLGRTYGIFGKSIRGQNLGNKELYATINMDSGQYFLPQNGVYATFSEFNGKRYASVSFVGNRLSTDRHFSVETHILDSVIEFLPPHLSVFFVQKIRDNEHFGTLSELKAQIGKDIKRAREILADS